jgi:hypothetical protein
MNFSMYYLLGFYCKVAKVKGIVSRDFGVLFLISLNRYEPPDRAGSGLFFILMTFLY